MLVPHVLDESLTGHDPTGIDREPSQQIELPRPQIDRRPAPGHPPRPGPDRQGADEDVVLIGDRCGRADPSSQLQLTLDPGDQLSEPERLGDIVDGAAAQGPDDVRLVGARREHHDGKSRVVAVHLRAVVDPVPVGKHHIQQHQVRHGHGDCLMRATQRPHVGSDEPVGDKGTAQARPDERVVLNDEHDR